MNKAFHIVQRISFLNDEMILTVDGKEYTFELKKISQRLLQASKKERENYQISPSGYGIHWPMIDEDLSIDGLLGIRHEPNRKEKVTA